MTQPLTPEVGRAICLHRSRSSRKRTSSHQLLEEGGNRSSVLLSQGFHPGDAQRKYFRDNMNRLNGEGIVVLGVASCDKTSYQKFIDKQELNFPLLVDEDLFVDQAFGTWRLKKKLRKGGSISCARSTPVIQPDGHSSGVVTT